MNYWVYNISENHSILNQKNSNSTKELAEIEIRDGSKSIRTSIDDQFLTLNKKDDFFFDYYGTIIGKPITSPSPLTTEEISALEKKKTPKAKYPKKFRHLIPVSIIRIDRKLDDYMFSLKAVENYSQPYNHFKQKYTSFNEEDFNTVVKEMLYITRTTFGRLFNSLPRENQFEVLLALTEEYKTENIKSIGLLNAVRFLRKYLEDIIIDSGKYIIGSESLLIKLSKKANFQVDKIGFVDDNNIIFIDENLRIDLLSEQSSCFKELFNLGYDLSIIEELESEIQKNQETETRFEKIFKRRRWPIKLTI